MMLNLSTRFRKDLSLLRREDAKLLAKLWELIDNLLTTPFTGVGQPEALKENMSGYWARRINQKHRLVYKIENNIVFLESCYGHYGDK